MFRFVPRSVSWDLISGSPKDHEFQGCVCRRKTDHFHILQAFLAAGGENIVFGDVFLTLE